MVQIESHSRLTSTRRDDAVGRVTLVRDLISPDGSPDRFLDPRRALIGGVCRFVAVGPASRSAI
jgi:hypothetical protein